ncbi:MAG: FixH family protein [Pirellulales bacterium]|nr:FixH family protein [Pirellulales bacterium]
MANEMPTVPIVVAGPCRNLLWPGMIVVFLGVHILAMLVTVWIATRDRSFAIEPDYYQKGLHWDTIARQQRTNAMLGWRVELEIGNDAGVLGRRTLACKLVDKSGAPIEGAAINLVAFAHARGNERTSVVLEDCGEGVYVTACRFARKGLWEFRLVARRGRETFTYTEQIRI